MASISLWFLSLCCLHIVAFLKRQCSYQRLWVKINGESEYMDKSDSEKFRALFEKAKREDPEWLNDIFGNSMDILFNQNNESGLEPFVPSEEPETEKVNDFVIEQQLFLSLGYSSEDWSRLKDPIKDVILEKGVRKLKSGLPAEWLIGSAPRLPRPSTTASFPREGDAKSFDKSGKNKRSSPVGVDDNYDEDDVDDEDDPSNSFWPDEEELKNLLLEEGRWRANFMPGFMIPLLKQEAKFRFGIYKNWLSVLEDGIGDGFDAVAESFDEDDDDDDSYDDDKKRTRSSQFFSWRGASVDTDADDRRDAETANVRYNDFATSKKDPQAERRREYGNISSSIDSKAVNKKVRRSSSSSSRDRGRGDAWDDSSGGENRRERDYDDWLRSSIPASLSPPADRVPPSLSPAQPTSQQQQQGGMKSRKARDSIGRSAAGMSEDNWEDLSQVQRIELDRKRVAQQQEQKRKDREERKRIASISKNDWFQDSAGRGGGNYPGDGYEVPKSKRSSNDVAGFSDSFGSIRGVGRSPGRPGSRGDVSIGNGKDAAQYSDQEEITTKVKEWDGTSAAEDRSTMRSPRQDDGRRMSDSVGGGSRYEALRVRDNAQVMRPFQSQGTGEDSGGTENAENSADSVTAAAGVDADEEEEDLEAEAEELQSERWAQQQQESLKRAWEISAMRKPVPLPPKGSI